MPFLPRPSRFCAVLVLLALAASACLRSASSHAGDPAAVRTEIERLEHRLRDAMTEADTLTLGLLWAPEYLSTSAVGHTSTRAEALMAYGSGLVKVDSATISGLDIRPYGTTAVALGFLTWGGQAAGRPFGATVRFQHVWVQSGDGWRLVASQLTAQPAGRPPPR